VPPPARVQWHPPPDGARANAAGRGPPPDTVPRPHRAGGPPYPNQPDCGPGAPGQGRAPAEPFPPPGPPPNHGLTSDGRHLTPPITHPADLSAANVQQGYPLRNLLTLQALDAVWREIAISG